MKLLLSQGAENLAPLQYPTLQPLFTSVAKRCSTQLQAWLAGRDQQQQPQAHSDPGYRAPIMALLAATSHYCHGTKPFIELEVQIADFGLCRFLAEEDSNFSFLEWLSAFRGHRGAHLQEACGSGCNEMWPHKQVDGGDPIFREY